MKTIVNRKINFAILGCGRIAHKHANAILSHSEHANLVAVCDINGQISKEFAAEFHTKGYNDYSEMLKHDEIDVIVITTPSGLHPAQVIEASKHKKHIVCEKPLATTWQDGKDMVKATEDNGVQLFVVKQNRMNPTLALLKKAIDENRFGKIYMVNINVFWTRPQEYYDRSPWLGSLKLDGGALMNQASHYVDLLDWLFGPIEQISSFNATLARKIESEDSAVLNLRWKSGALGSMNVTMLTYPKNLEASITILGEKGSVKIGGVSVNKIELWDFAESSNKYETQEELDEASRKTTEAVGLGHPLYYKNVIETLQGKAQAAVDGKAGLQSLEILCAAQIASNENRVVKLPL